MGATITALFAAIVIAAVMPELAAAITAIILILAAVGYVRNGR